MNDHENSQFEHNYFESRETEQSQNTGSGSRSYEYMFSSEHYTPTPPKRTGGYGKKIIFSFLTAFLCAGFSFVAAFGGVYLANSLGDDNAPAVNVGPDKNDLLQSDPEDILSKAPAEGSVYGSAGEDVFDVSSVVRKVEDSVVVIDAKIKKSTSFGGVQTTTSAGSGVIISAEGYILTCNHVVEGAVSVTVTLASGSQYEAALVGSDARSDLAVLCIEPRADEPLTYAEQGCSADLVKGEHVVAIGNPLGMLGGTVSNGIISYTEREIAMSDGTVMTLLQTNAAINSGNSGGGLFNLDGKLIGIVNAKYSAEGVEGLAFAIPVDSAYAVQLDLIEYGYVRGVVDHGLETLDVTESNYAQYHYYYKVDRIGVYVVSSEYCKELENKDCILSVNGKEITTTKQLDEIIGTLSVGDTVILDVVRDGKSFTVSFALQEYVPDGYKKLQ